MARLVPARVANVLNLDAAKVFVDFVEDPVIPVTRFPRPAGAIPLVHRAQVGGPPEKFGVGEQAVSDPVGGVKVVLGDVEPDPLGLRKGRVGPDYFKVPWAAFCFASSRE